MRGVPLIAVLALAALVGSTGAGRAGECERVDFEAAVEQAAAALKELNLKNRPTFQERLRQLKSKRGWSHDEFLKNASPFVRDDEIERFDRQSDDSLRRVTAMGEAGAQTSEPDCGLLEELRGHMRALVEAQSAKWAYMFRKIEAELER